MHDPITQAFIIRYPWWRMQKSLLKNKGMERYHAPFITVWHLDPCKGGGDDSCGWSYPRLTKKQIERLKSAAWWEAKYPHFLCCESKEWDGTITEAEALYRGLILLVCRVLSIRFSWAQVSKMAAEAIHVRTAGEVGDTFCFVPGYHTNSEKDTHPWREDHFTGILCGVARNVLDAKRHWWQHPRWHVHHWRLQIHPWQTFKRRFIDRCSKCGGHFRRGEPAIGNWSGTQIWHDRCDDSKVPIKY